MAEAKQPDIKRKIDATSIRPCKCKSSFQDSRYGLLKRLHNTAYKGSVIKGHRCTICGDIKNAGA
jgi:hypothetical protein